MSKTVLFNGIKYYFVTSTREFRDKEPKPIKDIMPKTDLGIMDMAFKKERAKRE